MDFLRACLFCSIAVATIANVNAYNAVVFEYSPLNATTPGETAEKNAEKIKDEILNLDPADIVVFPEYGITTKDFTRQNFKDFAVEISGANGVNFCDTDDGHLILKKLSCAAKAKRVYVVVNLLEKEGKYVYNTNIVFDRTGAIVHKYRKMNLDFDFEKVLTAGSAMPEPFAPDFGGYFVTITGNDITHKKPAVDIFQASNVTEVIYPNIWFTELPFKSALSVQSGYARRYGINLLSAGYSKPIQGNGGCGIFTPVAHESKISISTIPATKMVSKSLKPVETRKVDTSCSETDKPSLQRGLVGRPNINNFLIMTDVSLNFGSYNFEISKPGIESSIVCSKDHRLCCNYEMDIVHMPANISYAVMAYSDKNKGEFGCALVACEISTDFRTCGRRLAGSDLEVKTIRLQAAQDFIKEEYFSIPSTVNQYLEVIEDYKYCVKDGEIVMELTTPLNSVSVFGFFGKSISFGINLKANFLVVLAFAALLVFKS